MADNDLSSLLQSIGIKTDTELAADEQARQMHQMNIQLSQQRNNLDVGNLSTGYGFPAYMAAQMRAGNPGAGVASVPSINPQMGQSGRTPGIMPGATGQSGKLSDQLRALAQDAMQRGDRAGLERIRPALAQALMTEETQDLKVQENARQQAELRQKQTAMGATDTVGVKGRPDARQSVTQKRDPKTGEGLWNPDGSPQMVNVGPDYTVSHDSTTIDVGGMLTGPREENAAKDFATETGNTLNFLHSATPVLKLLKEGASSGRTGDYLTAIDNVLATARTSLSLVVDNPESVTKMINTEFSDKGKWKRAVGKTQLSQSAMVGLAYTLASSYNKDGRISDNDMKKALEELGGNLSDPESAARVLTAAIQRTKGRYQTTYRTTFPLMGEGMKGKIKEMYENALGDFNEFDKTPETPAPVTGGWDAEKEARYQEYLRNRPKQ